MQRPTLSCIAMPRIEGMYKIIENSFSYHYGLRDMRMLSGTDLPVKKDPPIK